jgi:hypothetical protein
MKDLNLKLTTYKAKLLIYTLNKEITVLKKHDVEVVELIEIKNYLTTLIQNS